MDTLSPHPSTYISQDEFVHIRRLQDNALNDRFSSIDNSIDKGLGDLKVEVSAQFAKIDARFDKNDARFDKIDARFDKIDARFDKIDAQFREIKLEWLRMSARFQNYTLKNPTIRITPVVVLDRSGEIASPDPQNFPRNAKEFYAMRDEPNERRARMLNYLVGFYDVQLDHQDLLQSDSEASDDGSPKQRVDTTSLAVERLETILGLNEENFVKFKERAAALAHRSPQPPIKRRNPRSTSAEGERKYVSRPFQRVPTKPNSLGSSVGERQSSETSSSQRRMPLAFETLGSLNSNEDPIESPTNKYSTPERQQRSI